MLELHDVHTYYGNIHAFKGITIEVEQGEIVTLIGRTEPARPRPCARFPG